MPTSEIHRSPPNAEKPIEAPTSYAVQKMGEYLTLFAQKKTETGPITTYEFMQQKELETDRLTKLGNERLLLRTLENLTAKEDSRERKEGEEGSKLGLIMFDLDKFKAINDTLGHGFGDQILAFIGEKLPTILRSTDVAAHTDNTTDFEDDESPESSEVMRKHGDEFYIVVSDLDDTRNGGSKLSREERQRRLAERVDSELTVAVLESALGKRLKEADLAFGLSAGAVIYQPGEGVDGLLQAADASMYQAKRAKGVARS